MIDWLPDLRILMLRKYKQNSVVEEQAESVPLNYNCVGNLPCFKIANRWQSQIHPSFPDARPSNEIYSLWKTSPGWKPVGQGQASPTIAPSRHIKPISLFQSFPWKLPVSSATRNVDRMRMAAVATRSAGTISLAWSHTQARSWANNTHHIWNRENISSCE
jgi:hypothetical protein